MSDEDTGGQGRGMLAGRDVVVAGAGGRLGAFVVRELLARGARVAGISRNEDKLAALGAAQFVRPTQPGGGDGSGLAAGAPSGVHAGEARLVALVASASDDAQLAQGAARLAELGWRPSALVACLGGWWQEGSVLDVSEAQWRDLFASHLLGHALSVRHFAPLIAREAGGAVVMSGGIGTATIVPGAAPISVLGAAQRALMYSLRAEDQAGVRYQEVEITGPLAQDERNEDGDPAVPGEVAAGAIAEVIAGRHGQGAIVRVGPRGVAS